MAKLVALLDPVAGVYAVAEVRFKPPYNILPDDRPVVDYNCEQMKDYISGIMVEQALKHGIFPRADFSSRVSTELLYYTCEEANKQGIRIYCLGNPEIEATLTTSTSGTSAEEIVRIIYNYDGFKVVHCHDSSSSEQGFDLVVRHQETGVLGIVEVKAQKNKGRLKTYLPFVKSLNAREMSLPWILHHCKLLEGTAPDLAYDIMSQLQDKRLERFVIVINSEDRSITFFINENFYDDGIDEYLIGGKYRSHSKEKVRVINVDLDAICKASHEMWNTGLPLQIKKEFDDLRKTMRKLIAEQEKKRKPNH